MTIIVGSVKDATGISFMDKAGRLIGAVGIDEAGRFRRFVVPCREEH